MKSSTTRPQSRQEIKTDTSILAENPLKPSVFRGLDTFPSLLTQQDYWLPADQKKIPVLPESDIHIKGERLDHCQHWQQVRPLIERNIHPFAVYLHNQQEPYITLDVDHGRNPDTGEPADWLKPLFKRMGIQWNATIDRGEAGRYPYIEISSSGTGYHVLFQGKTDYGKRSWFTTELRGKDAPKLEVIAHNSLMTYTGNQLPCSGQKALPIEPLLQYLAETYPDQHQPEPVQAKKNNVMTPEWRRKEDKELTADQIADMLDRLPPDCHYDEWIQIGMAIHDWNDGYTGKDLWQQWSQGGDKYDAEAQKSINSAWKGFRAGKGVGVGTLVKLAMDNGYQFPRRVSRKQVPPRQKPSDTNKTTHAEADNVTPISEAAAQHNQFNEKIDALVSQYNKIFVHTRFDSKNLVLQLVDDDQHRQRDWLSMSFTEFKEMLIHEPPVPISEEMDSKGRKKTKCMSPAQIWLTSKNANFIPCSTFYPRIDDPDEWPPTHNGKLNLYRGFAVDPLVCTQRDPDVQKWLYHIRHVVCQDDVQVFQYWLDWLAHMIQKPEEKPQTAIIMKGEQGTGKNAAMKPILKILGVHGLYVERPGAVSGKHNKVLENKVLTFADEAAFTTPSDCRILRALITETSSITEPKGIDSYSQQNFMRLVMATNSDSPVLFASDERRYLVVKLSTEHKQDYAYFAALKAATDNQLAGKLLYLFQQRDISDFLPMKIPKTKYLTEGKINNLEPQQAFVYEALMNGSFQSNGGWPARMDKKNVQTWFKDWLDSRHIRFEGDRDSKLGAVLCNSGFKKTRPSICNERIHYYEFSELPVCREKFEKNIMNGSTIDWDGHDDE